MRKLNESTFYFLLFTLLNLVSQISFAQNVTQISNTFQGKVLGIGFNHGSNGSNIVIEKEFFLNCSQCNTIGNAYIIAYEIDVNSTIETSLTPTTIYINNYPVKFDVSSRVGAKKNILDGYCFNHFKSFKFNCIDNKIVFKIPNQPLFHHITGFFIVLECLNSTSDFISYDFVINTETDNTNLEILQSDPLSVNAINPNKDVGFSVIGLVLNFIDGDANSVSLNNNFLGNIAGQDLSSINFFGSGVRGHFEYENGVLYGLDDDTPDFFMDSSDALANVKNLITNNTSVYFSSIPEDLGNITNNTQAIILSYTSNCEEFSYTAPPDTTTCANSPLQLLATGGTSTGSLPAYEWQPATGLSCTNCPNPVFTSDSSMFYTVRIRSNDSCSVVRPLKINVRPQPVFSEILTTKSECFGTTGSITSTSQAQGASYSLDGGAVQSSGFFENLAAGDYTLTLHDVNGCTKDTLITIEDTLTVSAQFSVNPSSGAAPLTVQITNQSQHATDYEWFLNGALQGNSFPSYTFDTSGLYQIMLYAWQNNPSCIDSFSISIQVYDSLMVEIPNVFTPNNDGINEAFGVTVNIPAEVNYRIFNRWGNEMKAGSVLTTPGVFVPIWSGNEASEGVYFYQLEVRDLSVSSPSVPLPKGEAGINATFNGFFELRK